MTQSYLVDDIIMWSVILEVSRDGEGSNTGGVRIGKSVGRCRGGGSFQARRIVSVSGITTQSNLVGEITRSVI